MPLGGDWDWDAIATSALVFSHSIYSMLRRFALLTSKVLVRIMLFTFLFFIQWNETRRPAAVVRVCGGLASLSGAMLFVVMRLNCCRFVLSAFEMARPLSLSIPLRIRAQQTEKRICYISTVPEHIRRCCTCGKTQPGN